MAKSRFKDRQSMKPGDIVVIKKTDNPPFLPDEEELTAEDFVSQEAYEKYLRTKK